MRYHQKIFENDHAVTIEKAKRWAEENLTVKWYYCLEVVDWSVKVIVYWYE